MGCAAKYKGRNQGDRARFIWPVRFSIGSSSYLSHSLTVIRSTGAYSLSIWTHYFQDLQYEDAFTPVNGNVTYSAVIAGSGHTWGKLYNASATSRRIVVGGGNPTVGLGGHIGGGGHGPLTSTYGMAADNVLQATVVTTTGLILVANDYQNQDIFWAIRGVSFREALIALNNY
jgi:FAD binding domain